MRAVAGSPLTVAYPSPTTCLKRGRDPSRIPADRP